MKRLARHFAAVGALCAATVLLAQPAPPGAPSGADGSPPSKEAWDFRGIKGEILRTPHYRVYTTERDTVLKGRLTETLELALAQYRSAIVDTTHQVAALYPCSERADEKRVGAGEG